MSYSDPKKLALGTSALITACYLIIYITGSLLFDVFNWLFFFSSTLLLFLLIYFLLLFTVNRFIY
mgnify:FL=1